MNRPLVSLVTPAYNQAQYLEQTIESVLSQDFHSFEYVVLDDGSTDATRDVLGRYTGRLRWETHANMGQARTLNKGWHMSSGDIVGYLSADDILYPGALTALVQALEERSCAVMVYPNYDLIDSQSRVLRRSVGREATFESLVIEQDNWVGPGALFWKRVLDAVGGWDPRLRLAPDRDFWMRMLAFGRLEMIPRTLAGYRIHPQSITHVGIDRDGASEYRRVTERYFDQSSIPDEQRRYRARAIGRAYLTEARIHLRAGRIADCVRAVRHGLQLDSSLRPWRIGIALMRTLVSRPLLRFQSGIRHWAARWSRLSSVRSSQSTQPRAAKQPRQHRAK